MIAFTPTEASELLARHFEAPRPTLQYLQYLHRTQLMIPTRPKTRGRPTYGPAKVCALLFLFDMRQYGFPLSRLRKAVRVIENDWEKLVSARQAWLTGNDLQVEIVYTREALASAGMVWIYPIRKYVQLVIDEITAQYLDGKITLEEFTRELCGGGEDEYGDNRNQSIGADSIPE